MPSLDCVIVVIPSDVCLVAMLETWPIGGNWESQAASCLIARLDDPISHRPKPLAAVFEPDMGRPVDVIAPA
jgi:hypothetical protein